MAIIRSPRVQRDFTVISNSVCLDARLSMRALGLLVRLLCRPDNWQTNSETLAREFGCGREQMRSVLVELSSAGYMQLQKSQDAAGRWSSTWAVFDEPVPAAEDPKPGKPGPGKPYVGGLGPITRTDLPRTDTKTPIAPTAKPKRKASEERLLSDWLASLPEGEAAIPAEDPIFSDGIPDDMLSLGWQVFKERYTSKAKTYKDWRAAFRDHIRGDYLKLWAIDREGSYYLTTAGKQAAARLGVPA